MTNVNKFLSVLVILLPIIAQAIGAYMTETGNHDLGVAETLNAAAPGTVSEERINSRGHMNVHLGRGFIIVGLGIALGGGLLLHHRLTTGPHAVSPTGKITIPVSLIGDDPSLASLDKADAEADAWGLACKAKIDDVVAKKKTGTQIARTAMPGVVPVAKAVGT